MNKKLFLSILFLIITISFCFSYSFATNNPVDGVRNVVGGAENVVEDAAKGVTNGVREGMNKVENVGRNTADMIGGNNKDNSTFTGMLTDDNNGGDYTAQRTTTRNANANAAGNIFGTNSTLWAWLTMAILAIAIVALVWYYGKQFNYTSHNNNDDNY